jgi:RNA polymerase sigma-70 factor (ECF subfamily)
MTDLERLYRRHASDVHRFCFWLCGDTAQAEDLTSEVFVRAWAGVDRIRAESAKAYLLTIARNLHREHYRRSRRAVPLDPELPDRSPGPEENHARRRELADTMRALGRLPESDREALLLRAELELPYEEIGRILGIAAGAARVRVHRARARLAAYRAEGGKRDDHS